MDEFLKRSWVEVDLWQIQENYKIYKENISPNASVMAVVKANAYGHGDVEITKTLAMQGINCWAVSNIEEAIRIRTAGIKGDILILGYTPINQFRVLEQNDITQAIISEEYAQAIVDAEGKMKCQIALDTGMNRIGLNADDPNQCVEKIKSYANNIKIDGIFTHLCVADSQRKEDLIFTQNQIYKFEGIVDRLQHLELKYIHCLNSAGGLWHKTKYNSLVRLGIILYGLKPDYMNVLPQGIKPALKWKSVVSMVKTVHRGETVGYGCSYEAEEDITVATVPTGYADGYNRLLSNKGHVIINGKKAPIIGKICMDQFMINISGISNVEMGTEVYLLTDTYNADDMASEIGTIGYEVICNISKRVPRVYLSR